MSSFTLRRFERLTPGRRGSIEASDLSQLASDLSSQPCIRPPPKDLVLGTVLSPCPFPFSFTLILAVLATYVTLGVLFDQGPVVPGPLHMTMKGGFPEDPIYGELRCKCRLGIELHPDPVTRTVNLCKKEGMKND